jgi:uridine kinase
MQFVCGGIRPLAGLVLSKDKGIKEVVRKIRKEMKNTNEPVLVRIAGGSASGKTTIAEIIRNKFVRDSVLLTQDNYYIGREYSETNGFNFDQPESLDLEKMKQDILDLKKNQSIQEPIYSFLEDGGKRIGYKTVEPRKLIIVEGLFVLNEKLSGCGGLKIFVKTSCHGRFVRRVIRDISRTCWEPNKILGYFLDIVDPMHKQYIDTQECSADIVILNQYDSAIEPKKVSCQEHQVKIKIPGPLAIKTLHTVGAEFIFRVDQEDVYFSVLGKQENEILRLRKEGSSILFSYKAPATKSQVRTKRKVEFPISENEEKTIQSSCREELRIFKSRDLFLLDGIVFSQDCLVIPGKQTEYFLEIREKSIQKSRLLLKKLGIESPKILRSSYYELLK